MGCLPRIGPLPLQMPFGHYFFFLNVTFRAPTQPGEGVAGVTIDWLPF